MILRAAWKAELMAKGTHCEDQVYLQNVYYFCSSVNIFTDWATALMQVNLSTLTRLVLIIL